MNNIEFTLANQARKEKDKLLELLIILLLYTLIGVANILEEKKEALQNQFFLELETDLSNITNISFEDTIDQLNSDY